MSDIINNKMITLARDYRGMSQAELADEISSTQGYVSKVENGLVEMSQDNIERVAKATRLPVEFFFLTDRVAGPGVGCHYRRRKAVTAAKLRELQARMNVSRLRFERLLAGIELHPEYEFVHIDVDEFDGTPEDIAAQLRRMWHIPYGPIDNLTSVIENAGGLVMTEPFGTDKVDEMTQWLSGHRPFFFLNSTTPTDRYRWSLAHGLGHVIMHGLPDTESKMEDDANRFAGEFLAPAAEIGPDLERLTFDKLGALKVEWRMSMQAIVMRAYHLGAITDRQRRSFFTRLTKMGYRKQEPYPLPAEPPMLLNRIVEFHRSAHEYTFEQIAKTALTASEHEFRIECLQEPSEPPRRLRAV